MERISDTLTFIDRGRIVDCANKEVFLERWRRIQVQLPPGAALPDLPNIVKRETDGHFVTLTTNQFSEGLQKLIGPHVTHVQRMNLEEIFVANVMYHREARGQ